jgi:hypothetical protein
VIPMRWQQSLLDMASITASRLSPTHVLWMLR